MEHDAELVALREEQKRKEFEAEQEERRKLEEGKMELLAKEKLLADKERQMAEEVAKQKAEILLEKERMFEEKEKALAGHWQRKEKALAEEAAKKLAEEKEKILAEKRLVECLCKSQTTSAMAEMPRGETQVPFAPQRARQPLSAAPQVHSSQQHYCHIEGP